MNYDLFIGLHILSVIAWMAGMLYLPRLFVYHIAKPTPGSPDWTETLQGRWSAGCFGRSSILPCVAGGAWILGA